MALSRNLLAGLTNSIWSALIGLAVVPFYLKYLGIEAYGLIGFFVTTQAVLSLLDMGLAPTINREVARCSASGDLREAGKLLHTLAVIYWVMAGVIALLMVLLAPLIAEYWLQSKQLPIETITHTVMLMGLVVAFRWPIGLYQGALIGAHRLTISSGINIVMTTISSLGAVSILAFVSPTVEAFFIWQACLGLLYAFVIRGAAWQVIGRLNKTRFDVEQFKNIWRFSVGISGIALSAIVLTQLDKLILSKTLDLEAFGHYMLATTIGGGLYLLIMPVYNIIYPRFSSLVAAGSIKDLGEMYRVMTRLFTSVLFPIAMALAFGAKDFVIVWTGDPAIALTIAPIISLLVLGTALHGVMFFPYALQLAYGMTRLPLTINTILMVVLVPLTIFLSLKYGALGGGISWLVLHVFYLLIGTWLTHRQLLKGTGMTWLYHDVFIPLCVSGMVGLIGLYINRNVEYSTSETLIFSVILALIATLLSFAIMPNETRNLILPRIRRAK